MDRFRSLGLVLSLVMATALFAQGPRGSTRATTPQKPDAPINSRSDFNRTAPLALDKHRREADRILKPTKPTPRLTTGDIQPVEGSDESLEFDMRQEQARLYSDVKDFLKLVDDKVTAKVLIKEGPEITLFRRLGALRGKGNTAIFVETLRDQSKEPLSNAQVIFKIRELRIMMARYSAVLKAIPNDPAPYAEWSLATLVSDSQAPFKTDLSFDSHFLKARTAYTIAGGGPLAKELETLAKSDNADFNDLVSASITSYSKMLATKEVAKSGK